MTDLNPWNAPFRPNADDPAPRFARPLSEPEVAFLRDYLQPVRTEVELRRLRAEKYRESLSASSKMSRLELAVMVLCAMFIGFLVAAGGL